MAELEAMLTGPEMPAPLAYLVGWAEEMGFCQPVGMGLAPLTFAEIGAWAALRGIALAPWEAQGLRVLSEAFCEASASST